MVKLWRYSGAARVTALSIPNHMQSAELHRDASISPRQGSASSEVEPMSCLTAAAIFNAERRLVDSRPNSTFPSTCAHSSFLPQFLVRVGISDHFLFLLPNVAVLTLPLSHPYEPGRHHDRHTHPPAFAATSFPDDTHFHRAAISLRNPVLLPLINLTDHRDVLHGTLNTSARPTIPLRRQSHLLNPLRHLRPQRR